MILLGKIALGTASIALVGASVLCSEGLVRVKVVEKQPQGLHINIVAPAILAPIAVRLAPRHNLAQAARQIQPYMPVVRAAVEGLSETDDGVLVEVKEPGEHVQVSKSHGSIVVNVDDADEMVHVSAPIRAISSTVEQLATGTSNPLATGYASASSSNLSSGRLQSFQQTSR